MTDLGGGAGNRTRVRKSRACCVYVRIWSFNFTPGRDGQQPFPKIIYLFIFAVGPGIPGFG